MDKEPRHPRCTYLGFTQAPPGASRLTMAPEACNRKMPVTQNDLFESDQRRWLAEQFGGLTVEFFSIKPSQWAEDCRYLPPSVTALAGPYSFDVAPYLKEIVDCLAVDSPVRIVTWMKGVQICATVGVLENGIGYYIVHVKTAPMMMITATDQLAQQRMDANIIPMLQHSGMMDLIQTSDEGNKRKQGKTAKKIQWQGGGWVVPSGARSAPNLRSLSVQVLFLDEIDAWPDSVGNDGDPLTLAHDRTAAFEDRRKIVQVSTPLIAGTSRIEQQYLLGDQRKYFVRCLRCEYSQVLRWKFINNDTGEENGMRWEMDDAGNLIPGSVVYKCQECGEPHSNAHKARLFHPDNAEWRPTNPNPSNPEHRSYHLSALYSPPGMQAWEACVRRWLEAWDVKNDRVRDLDKLQVFYNNILGETYEPKGSKVLLKDGKPSTDCLQRTPRCHGILQGCA